jgi:hypothetical protein
LDLRGDGSIGGGHFEGEDIVGPEPIRRAVDESGLNVFCLLLGSFKLTFIEIGLRRCKLSLRLHRQERLSLAHLVGRLIKHKGMMTSVAALNLRTKECSARAMDLRLAAASAAKVLQRRQTGRYPPQVVMVRDYCGMAAHAAPPDAQERTGPPADVIGGA